MSLQRYKEKRKFNETPEPPPKMPAGKSGNMLCIQRHAATRLHYDFRLEINGALASWAVPHGPSLDPKDKRLAMKVEDHPLDYGHFEGVIPAGNYGAGSVMLWDLGTWSPLTDTPVDEQLKRGDFKFSVQGKKLQGSFGLIRMKGRGKGDEWLLIKKKDEFVVPGWNVEDFARSVTTGRTQEEIAAGMEASHDPLPAVVRPMLAESVKEPPEGSEWIFEVKWDGVRSLAYIANGEVVLRSRKGDDITAQYPELRELPKAIRANIAILDGEIAVCDERGRPRFELIQPRIMARGQKQITELANKAPARYFAFDLLYADGRDLRQQPLSLRKKQLTSVLTPSPAVQLSTHFESQGRELLEAARQQGMEGIIAKRAASRYVSSRTGDWLKIKIQNQEDFVICGFTKGARQYFGALVLGERDESGKLTYVGNAGTGFDDSTAAALYKKMEPLRRKDSPFARPPKLPQPIVWIEPELVCKVRYLERTSAGRLRAPVYAGLAEPVAVEPSFPPSAKTGKLTVDGHQLSFSNLQKVLFPQDGVTKRDLLEFYDQVSKWLLPHLLDRPLSLLRFPNGIGEEGFFQKNMDSKMAPWLRKQEIPLSDDSKVMAIGGARPDLLYLVNLACIDQNPWMSRVGSLDNPDFVLIDLDPHEAEYDKVVTAALHIRVLLESVGLQGYPKTTGGDGMHIYVPVAPQYTYDQTKTFAELLARMMEHEHPRVFTLPRSVAARTKGRIYFDWIQNGRGKTISAPYVVRPKPGAPVATPLDWSEVKTGLDPKQFHIRNALDRFRSVGDLFAPVLSSHQHLEKPMAQLAEILKPATQKRHA